MKNGQELHPSFTPETITEQTGSYSVVLKPEMVRTTPENVELLKVLSLDVSDRIKTIKGNFTFTSAIPNHLVSQRILDATKAVGSIWIDQNRRKVDKGRRKDKFVVELNGQALFVMDGTFSGERTILEVKIQQELQKRVRTFNGSVSYEEFSLWLEKIESKLAADFMPKLRPVIELGLLKTVTFRVPECFGVLELRENHPAVGQHYKNYLFMEELSSAVDGDHLFELLCTNFPQLKDNPEIKSALDYYISFLFSWMKNKEQDSIDTWDEKPENYMVAVEDGQLVIYLIDFESYLFPDKPELENGYDHFRERFS